MSTETETRPAGTGAGVADLDHVFCWCDENIALCGADVTDEPVIDSLAPEKACVVCIDLDKVPCERCGA